MSQIASPQRCRLRDSEPRPDGLLQLAALQQPFQRRFHLGLPAETLVEFQPQPREVRMGRNHHEPDVLQEVGVDHALVERAVAERLRPPNTGIRVRGSNSSDACRVRPNASSARTPRRTNSLTT